MKRITTATALLLGAMLLGGTGMGCDVEDPAHDNAKGRTDNDGAPSMSGSEPTGKTNSGNRTMPGGNTIPTTDQ